MSHPAVTSRAVDAWSALLHATGSLSRALNARLQAEHGLTLSDYEVLLALSQADGCRMKRSELAQQVVLTPSGITRLLDGLEVAGYVAKGSCPGDARVTYAVLTDAGAEKLRDAAASHLADVEALFGARYDDGELGELHELLARLAPARSCAPS